MNAKQDPAILAVKARLLALPHQLLTEDQAKGFSGKPVILLPADDAYQLPTFQLGGDGKLLPVVAQINEMFGAERDPWGSCAWWDGKVMPLNARPMDLLGKGLDAALVNTARAFLKD